MAQSFRQAQPSGRHFLASMGFSNGTISQVAQWIYGSKDAIGVLEEED
jgi:hypothetical protein